MIRHLNKAEKSQMSEEAYFCFELTSVLLKKELKNLETSTCQAAALFYVK